jgi:circadian clock protein KaiB
MKKKVVNKRAGRAQPKKRKTVKDADDFWTMRLYIAGQTPNSMAAVTNLRNICEEKLQGRYRIEVIDLLKKPQLAKGDQIVAIPTLVRKIPSPMKRIIGNMSQAEKVLVGLDLKHWNR